LNKSEQLVNALPQPFRQDEGEKGGRDVLAGLDRADGLARDACQAGELLLRKRSLGTSDLESILQARIAHHRSFGFVVSK
jgi:hypothetical protein